MTKRTLSLLLSLLLVLAPMLAMGEAPVLVTDMMGRDIRLNQPATKVVALMPGDCEVLYAIGAGDTLIGRGEWCNYPEEVLNVVSDAQNIQDVYISIDLLGKLTGHEEEAAKLIEGMQTDFAALRDLTKDKPEATVYFESSELQYGLWPAVSGTFMQEVGELLGLTNIFGDLTAWAEVSEEEVIKRNPDYIVSTNLFATDGRAANEEIMARPGWNAITAVKEGHVYALGDTITRPAPRLVDAARALYDLIYGEEK